MALACLFVTDGSNGRAAEPLRPSPRRRFPVFPSEVRRSAQGFRVDQGCRDRVVIDGGALLDDGIASALMPLADQVVLVARSGQTMSADLVDAARLVDVPLDRRSGVVLTMSPSTTRQRALPSAAQTS